MVAAQAADAQPAEVPPGGFKKRRRPKPVLEPLPADGGGGPGNQETGNSKFARALGSVDYLTRERGVQALSRFLQRKAAVDPTDMLKLWKGLFFCFWHSDKAPVQADLADRLAGITGSLSPEVAYAYATTFFTTMQREWHGIDRLRLDKFLMLVRNFVGALFRYMAANSWRPDVVTRYMHFLQQHVLLPQGAQRAAGLTYHICDVYVPELKRTLAAGGGGGGVLGADTLRALLAPFVAALQQGGDDALLGRVRGGVFEPLVEEVLLGGSEEEEGEGGDSTAHNEAEAAGSGGALPRRLTPLLGALTPADLAAHLFATGAAQGVRGRNRTALYDLSQQFERAARKRAKRQGTANGAAAAAVTGDPPTVNGAARIGNGKQKKVAGAGMQQQSTGKGAANGSLPAPQAKTAAQRSQPSQPPLQLPAQPLQPRQPQPAQAKQTEPQVHQHQPPPQRQRSQPAVKGLKAVKLAGRAVALGTATQQRTTATPSPITRQEPPPPASTTHTGKKSVRINLKKNLYFEFGGPVPDPLLRTPPTARPKGSILKRRAPSSVEGPGPSGGVRKVKKQRVLVRMPRSAPPKMVTVKITPSSIPRVCAADLFN